VALLTNGGDATGLFREMFAATFARLGRVTMPQPPQPVKRRPTGMEWITGRYENLTGIITITEQKNGIAVEVTSKPGMLAGLTVTKTPARIINRHMINLDSEDKQLARTILTFEGDNQTQADFVNMGMRLYRRS